MTFKKITQVESGDGQNRIRLQWGSRKWIVYWNEQELRKVITELMKALKVLVERNHNSVIQSESSRDFEKVTGRRRENNGGNE